MKRYLSFALICLVAAACREKKFGAFVIAGKVMNTTEQKVYLEEIPFTGEAPVVLDSTTLKKSGTFELRGMAGEEGLYRLVFENEQPVLFINDDHNIRLRLDANNYRGYTIEGSVASAQLHELLNKMQTIDSSFYALTRQRDTLASDSMMTLLNAEAQHLVERRRDLLNTFIRKTNSPAAICYAVGQYDPMTPASQLKQLLDAAAARFPEHSGIARFRSIIAMQVQPEAPAYPLLDQPAPDLRLPTPTGDTFALSELRGKYVLVDFWASWCAPCRKENPNVVAAYQKFKGRNFDILGVSLDQDKENWVQAISQDNLGWHHISDLQYWNSVAVKLYRFEGIPFNVLVDPQGKIIAADLKGAALEQKLSELLK
ncbi:MAG TPA: TlpA disulfide reductase family protein [Chitinophagaceae bacterium]